MRGLRAGVPVAIVLLVPLAAHAGNADQAEALRRGKDFFRLIEVNGSRSSRGFVRGGVDAPSERIFEIITDYDRYEDFMPRVEECHVVGRREGGLRYHAKLDMPWPVSNVWYDADVSWPPDRRSVRFQMIQKTGHGVVAFDGHWMLSEFEGSKTRTLVQYDILFEPTTRWPRWVLEMGMKATLGKMLPALRGRVARLARKTAR